MAKSDKKSAAKIDAAVIPAKPLKKGKREAEEVVDKKNAKKQKELVEEKKIEIKTKKKIVKKKAETSSDEESSSESEKELKVKVSSKNGALKPDLGSEDSRGLEEDVSVPKKRPAAKNSHVAAAKKKDESSSDSDSEDETTSDEDVAAAKKAPALQAKNVSVAAIKKEDKSIDESDSEDETSSDEDVAEAKKAPAALTKNVPVAAIKKEKSSDSDDETSSDEDVPAVKKAPTTLTKTAPAASATKKDESNDDSVSEDETSSDEEAEASKKTATKNVTKKVESTANSESDDESSSTEDEAPKKVVSLKKTTTEASQAKKNASSEDDSSDEESDDEEPQKKKIKAPVCLSDFVDTDVKMADAASAKANSGKGGSQIETTPKTPITPKEQSRGSKTLFVGNLSYSIEQADVENFFKNAGEIVEVRFSMFPDNSFRGFGHVEFATAAEAEKALREMNGKELLGRPVKLDLARERGSFTPHSGEKDTNSFQKGGRARGQTVFVRGFDKNGEEDQIRSSLEEHFGSCGEISRVSLPKDQEGGFKGMAYIDFTDSDGFNKALELNGSDIGEYTLNVEEAKPRNDASGGPRRGGRSGGGHSAGDRFGGRSGDRFGDSGRGRFGNRGRSGGHFGDGSRGGRFSRGRGTPNKPSMAAPGTGKKTTFNDDE
ncbi:uncharacterized protein [Primulina eburnea]|uniref:uncharacterized protein isoform X2 n=1 Tax=Primulina eburnea TaxID=1245227 RepID=UPI003C6C5918